MDRQMYDGGSEKLTWAFSSGKLKKQKKTFRKILFPLKEKTFCIFNNPWQIEIYWFMYILNTVPYF